MSFRDHFSTGARNYSQFRPRYPQALYRHLASLCTSHDRAWDCATGSGQAAAGLTDYFKEVVATDASAEQIANAIPQTGIIYKVAAAEASGLEQHSVCLLTVAQALHWFDIEAFATEADRVLRPDGIVAAWTYTLLRINQDVDRVINYLYSDILGAHWPVERKLVDDNYAAIMLPFTELESPAYEITAHWNFAELLGYLGTWSAMRSYQNAHSASAIELVEQDLAEAWGQPETRHNISWPLVLRVWRKQERRAN